MSEDTEHTCTHYDMSFCLFVGGGLDSCTVLISSLSSLDMVVSVAADASSPPQRSLLCATLSFGAFWGFGVVGGQFRGSRRRDREEVDREER